MIGLINDSLSLTDFAGKCHLFWVGWAFCKKEIHNVQKPVADLQPSASNCFKFVDWGFPSLSVPVDRNSQVYLHYMHYL